MNSPSRLVILVVAVLLGVHGLLQALIIDDYAVVIDAGSTGSRCFMFHVTVDKDDHRHVTTASCGKVTPGLSSFVDSPERATEHFAPLLQMAATMIPFVHHLSTHIFIKATAGMRLLTPEVQHKLWEGLVKISNERPDIPFLISEENIGTIDGHQEAFYAVLASNYIAKSIDGNLKYV
jgi:Golgi nucleoside diphosphatase